MIAEDDDYPVATTDHCLHCFDTVANHFSLLAAAPLPSFATHAACPLFVTWKSRANGAPSLRGCIGCLKPLPITSLRDYALTSALRDQRFDPIEPRELPQLSCTVSLLTHFERARDAHDWEVGSHGVLIDFDDPSGVARSGVYLPEVMVEQGWSRQQTIDSLIRKAGFKHTITDQLRHSLRLTRFRSTTATASYEQWAQARSGATL